MTIVAIDMEMVVCAPIVVGCPKRMVTQVLASRDRTSIKEGVKPK